MILGRAKDIEMPKESLDVIGHLNCGEQRIEMQYCIKLVWVQSPSTTNMKS